MKSLSEQLQLSFSQEVLASNCYYYMPMNDEVQLSLELHFHYHPPYRTTLWTLQRPMKGKNYQAHFTNYSGGVDAFVILVQQPLTEESLQLQLISGSHY